MPIYSYQTGNRSGNYNIEQLSSIVTFQSIVVNARKKQLGIIVYTYSLFSAHCLLMGNYPKIPKKILQIARTSFHRDAIRRMGQVWPMKIGLPLWCFLIRTMTILMQGPWPRAGPPRGVTAPFRLTAPLETFRGCHHSIYPQPDRTKFSSPTRQPP